MSGRTPADAVHNFLDPVRDALSCIVVPALQVGGGYHQSPEPHVMLLAGGEPVPLKGPRKLALTVHHHYRVVEAEGELGPFKVRSAAYIYAVDDASGDEVVSYHWHPLTTPDITFAHLHFRRVADEYQELLHGHFPTGRVSIERLVRFLIVELAVEPVRGDWQTVLDRTNTIFERYRTWA